MISKENQLQSVSKPHRIYKETVLKSLDFLFILFLVYIFLNTEGFTPPVIFKPVAIASALLFAYTFSNNLFDRQDRLWRFASSIFFSLLSIPSYIWSYLDSPYTAKVVIPMTLVGSSMVLSVFAFLLPNRRQKMAFSFLLAIDILMLFFNYAHCIWEFLVLFSFLVLTPYRYSKDKKAYLLSIAATVILLLLAYIANSNLVLILVSLYPLTIIFIRPKGCNKTLKSAFGSCFRFEVYKTHKYLKIPLIVLGILLILNESLHYGESLSDYRPFVISVSAAVMFLMMFELCRELSVEFKKLTDTGNLHLKGSLAIVFVSLLIVACQYLPYGSLMIVFIWFVILTLLIVYRFKYSNNKQTVLCGVITIIMSVIVVPQNSFGYQIFSHIKYAKVPYHYIGGSDELILIRDFQGNYGVRDRYNLIVPVKYKEILHVTCCSIDEHITAQRRCCGYVFDKHETQKWIHILGSKPLLFNPPYTGSGSEIVSITTYHSDDIPNVRFILKNQDGEEEIWDCNRHLNMPNLCTDLIKLSVKGE